MNRTVGVGNWYGPLQEQQMLLPVEPSLQPSALAFKRFHAFIYFVCAPVEVRRQLAAVFSFCHVDTGASNTGVRPQGQAPVFEPPVLLNWLLLATWNWAAFCSVQQNELSFL